MVDEHKDPLAEWLSEQETPLADEGFTHRVMAGIETANKPTASPAADHMDKRHWLILLLAALAGLLVSLLGISAVDLAGLLSASREEVISFAGFTVSGMGLWILAGWTLTLTGCGWSLTLAR
ncbi:hypothetical protein [Simiduia agarivorans]|uniref:Uncharacterized protein n=1 Tax=Simiduia agarivorans (strain DSM 21679 / JCM 13881 / BCRC 17597 / SA1) TaxID=1117647 RepID=K4L2I8_SIMAS|nr:hypothetical protein [Simiduia agarivorans]AFV00408.1 hypothetical protein M5M_16385 [Simiduia agarivorans SA1 = DSM 21679]